MLIVPTVKPPVISFQTKLSSRFDDMYKSLTCIPNLVDQLAVKYDSEDVWNKYRQNFLDNIDEYEDCGHLEDYDIVSA